MTHKQCEVSLKSHKVFHLTAQNSRFAWTVLMLGLPNPLYLEIPYECMPTSKVHPKMGPTQKHDNKGLLDLRTDMEMNGAIPGCHISDYSGKSCYLLSNQSHMYRDGHTWSDTTLPLKWLVTTRSHGSDIIKCCNLHQYCHFSFQTGRRPFLPLLELSRHLTMH